MVLKGEKEKNLFNVMPKHIDLFPSFPIINFPYDGQQSLGGTQCLVIVSDRLRSDTIGSVIGCNGLGSDGIQNLHGQDRGDISVTAIVGNR